MLSPSFRSEEPICQGAIFCHNRRLAASIDEAKILRIGNLGRQAFYTWMPRGLSTEFLSDVVCFQIYLPLSLTRRNQTPPVCLFAYI